MSGREKKLALIAILISFAAGAIYWEVYKGRGPVTGPRVSEDITWDVTEPPLIHKFTNADAMDSSGRPLFETARRITVLTTTVPEPEVIQPLPELPEKPIVLEIKEALLPPPTPPPPVIPPVPFQYTGYARDSADRMIAFIETTGGAGVPAGHYNLRESEIFMGRFRLTKVSTDSVEIEDMERSENSSDRKRTVSINALIASRKAP